MGMPYKLSLLLVDLKFHNSLQISHWLLFGWLVGLSIFPLGKIHRAGEKKPYTVALGDI